MKSPNLCVGQKKAFPVFSYPDPNTNEIISCASKWKNSPTLHRYFKSSRSEYPDPNRYGEPTDRNTYLSTACIELHPKVYRILIDSIVCKVKKLRSNLSLMNGVRSKVSVNKKYMGSQHSVDAHANGDPSSTVSPGNRDGEERHACVSLDQASAGTTGVKFPGGDCREEAEEEYDLATVAFIKKVSMGGMPWNLKDVKPNENCDTLQIGLDNADNSIEVNNSSSDHHQHCHQTTLNFVPEDGLVVNSNPDLLGVTNQNFPVSHLAELKEARVSERDECELTLATHAVNYKTEDVQLNETFSSCAKIQISNSRNEFTPKQIARKISQEDDEQGHNDIVSTETPVVSGLDKQSGLTDKCAALMVQSRGSSESFHLVKTKPVLNRISRFMVSNDIGETHTRMQQAQVQAERHVQFQVHEIASDEPAKSNSQVNCCDLIEVGPAEEDMSSIRLKQSNLTHSSSMKFPETQKISIKDRLAALQQESEQAWRKKLPPKKDIIMSSSPSLSSSSTPSSPLLTRKSQVSVSRSNEVEGRIRENMNELIEIESRKDVQIINCSQAMSTSSVESAERRVKKDSCTPESQRSVSIADRLSKLAESQERWVGKGGKERSDIHKFTVAGKMRQCGIEGESPLAITKKPSIRPVTMIEISPERPRSPDVDANQNNANESSRVVKIPKMDIDGFFEQKFCYGEIERRADSEVYLGEIHNLEVESDDMLSWVRKVRPQRKNRGSVNPLKTQSMYIEVSDEYVECRTGVADAEMERIKKERIIGNVQFAHDALAGLASKENFSQISLRKGSSFHGTGLGDRHLPYKNIMLLHIKGRRVCQTRLVDPVFNSLNSGDCFVLVTPETVYLWVGRFSNVIERAKALDLANQIVDRHDMGARPACQLVCIEEEKQANFRAAQKFWKVFGVEEHDVKNVVVRGPGPSDEDELYEAGVVSTNKVYKFTEEDQLELVPEYSGVALKWGILKVSETLVFDFGSEMYTWSGKNVPADRRRKAINMALNQLWNKGFNYVDDLIHPIHPFDSEASKTGSTRPPWCLFCKVSQNLETMLFKEKFIDWPDSGKVIRVKGRVSEGSELKTDLITEMIPCDIEPMLQLDVIPASLFLEGYHIGRGHKWEEVVDGIKWEYEMLTSDLEVWHIRETGQLKLDVRSFGQFHSGDTYVIRWRYNINQITRNLKGEATRKDVTTGRNRCAYFFWQGVHSSINEKGASALMTIELNQDNGPHVRLVQGKEPSCFIGLFSSKPMIVYLGKRLETSKSSPRSDIRFSKFDPGVPDPTNTSSPPSSPKFSEVPEQTKRMFMVRNELVEDSYLLEVNFKLSSLRSRSSFVLVDVGKREENVGRFLVWHGCKAAREVKMRMREFMEILVSDRCPMELSMHVNPGSYEEVLEGEETNEFWNWFERDVDRSIYHSLLNDSRQTTYTPRLFYFALTSGVFEVEEIDNPASNHLNIPSPFPFSQSDIYSVPQPALFLIDNNFEVYLWQGWWPQSSADCPNMQTGSAESKFMNMRKCAMRTALNYCAAKSESLSPPPPCYLVHAGCEPPQFKSLFFIWNDDEDAVLHAMQNNLESTPLMLVADVFESLNRSSYTWSELQARPLPDGVDPLKLETYLDDEEFQRHMGMTKSDFTSLPQWKQTNMKRDRGLF